MATGPERLAFARVIKELGLAAEMAITIPRSWMVVVTILAICDDEFIRGIARCKWE
jgi:hypothetical protein